MKVNTKCVASILILLVFFQAQVSALPNATSIILRVIRKPLVGAINSNDGVTDADPFVSALIRFIENNEEQAAGFFVQGLIVNAIKDPVKANKILDSIGGVAKGVSFGLTMAGQGGAVTQISDFVAAMGNAPMLDRWANAVEAGKEVTYKNGDLVIEDKEKVVVEEKEQVEVAGYVQMRDDEVLPMLNIRHGVKGAGVYLDGELVDTSIHDEYMFESLSAGKHVIRIATKYNEGSVQIFVNPARETPSGYDQVDLDIKWRTSKLQVDPGIDGLSVYLDDTLLGKTPIDRTIRAGEYKLSIEDAWIEDFSSDIDAIPDKEISFTPEIQRKGALKFSEEIPTTAKVKINGQPVEWKYSSVYLLPGEYTVTIKDEKMYDFQEIISITADEKISYSPDISYRTGVIAFDQTPPDSIDLYLDGEKITERLTPENSIEEVVIGRHVIAFDNPYNKEPIPLEVDIRESESTSLQLPVGVLEIQNMDEYIEVYINGKKADNSRNAGNNIEFSLLEGEYNIRLEGRYIKEHKLTQNISPGDTTQIAPDLIRFGIVPIKITDFNRSDGSFVIKIENTQKKQNDETIYDYTYKQIGNLIEIRVNKPGEVIDINQENKSALIKLPQGINRLTGTYTNDSPSFEKSLNVQVNTELPTLEIPMEHSQQFKLAQLEQSLKRHKRKTRWGWIMTGTSVLTAATAGMMYYLASESYSSYDSATITADAENYRSEVDTYSMMMYAGAGISAASIAIGSILFFSRADRDEIESNIKLLKTE